MLEWVCVLIADNLMDIFKGFIIISTLFFKKKMECLSPNTLIYYWVEI